MLDLLFPFSSASHGSVSDTDAEGATSLVEWNSEEGLPDTAG